MRLDCSEVIVDQDRACGSFSNHNVYSEPRETVDDETEGLGPPWQLDAAHDAEPSERIEAWVSLRPFQEGDATGLTVASAIGA